MARTSASVRFRVDAPSSVSRNLDRAAKQALLPKLREISDDMVRKAEQLARQRLFTDRPETRRRLTAGQAHYVDSFKAGAPDISGDRIRLVFYNDSPELLVKIIEFGSKPHRISATAGGDARIAFPKVTMRAFGGIYNAPDPPFRNSRGRRGARDGPWMIRRFVDHPGTRPYRIIAMTKEYAREALAGDALKVTARVRPKR